tara:strand:- start:8103 stop:8765 length:663 start_codon:yes stop_codon:yes gene_type:complete
LTKQLAVVNTAADTFDVWITRTNQLITAANTEFVTANTDANGSITTGNAYIIGIVHATTLTTSTLRGGNVQTSAVLPVSSNVHINASSTFLIGNSTVNVYANSSTITINGDSLLPLLSHINVQTAGTSAQLVDSIAKATYRGAEHLWTIMDNAANAFQMCKTIIFHDSGLDSYVTEYGMFFSNTQLGIFSSNANTTHFKLYITPTVANTQVKATRTVVAL